MMTKKNMEMLLPINELGAAGLVVTIDDYHKGNLRLATDLRLLGIKAMFFIDTQPEGAVEQIRAIHGVGHAIGCHTWSHPGDLKQLNMEELRGEFEISTRQIEDATGERPKTIAYPRGRFNDMVIDVAKNCGFVQGRTTHVGEIWSRLRSQNVTDPDMRLGTSVHVYNGRKEYQGRSWRMMADFWWQQAQREGGIFHIWAHMFELERDGQYKPFLDFLGEITEKQ